MQIQVEIDNELFDGPECDGKEVTSIIKKIIARDLNIQHFYSSGYDFHNGYVTAEFRALLDADEVYERLGDITESRIRSINTPDGEFKLRYPALFVSLPSPLADYTDLFAVNPYLDVTYDEADKANIIYFPPEAKQAVLDVISRDEKGKNFNVRVEECELMAGEVKQAVNCHEARKVKDSALIFWGGNKIHCVYTQGIIGMTNPDVYNNFTNPHLGYQDDFLDVSAGFYVVDNFEVNNDGDLEYYTYTTRPATLDDLNTYSKNNLEQMRDIVNFDCRVADRVIDAVMEQYTNQPKP